MDPIAEAVQVGIDLGQRADPTAVIVVEVERRNYDKDQRGHVTGGEFHYTARLVERLPLGTTYPAVVRRLGEIDTNLQERGAAPRYWVDATGLGGPVVDLLDAAGLPVVPVFLTGTDKAIQEGRELRLGKALLVSRLQVLLQAGFIHLPKTAESAVLVDELLTYEIRVNENAHAQFGAFKVGQHDDLATALGLACWQAPRSVSFGFG